MNLETIFIIVFAIAIISWLCGFIFLFRIPLCCLTQVNNFQKKVSIIIPARNEEENIGILLDSINDNKIENLEVIVLNDHSTDKTKEISLSKWAKVIDSEPLPKGWYGKPWACYQGAKSATGDLFIFLDSDTKIENDGLKKIVETYNLYCQKYKNDIVMSIAPYHKVEKFYEEFSGFFNIIMMGSMKAFLPFKNSETIGLFGQALVLSKENYFKIDGHKSVKDKILENMFMAEIFKSKNIKLKCFGGKNSLSFRMYKNGIGELINGWAKAFASGASQVSPLSLFNIILWISSGFLIFISFIISIINNIYITISLILYFAYSAQLFWMLYRIGSFKTYSAFLFPIHLCFYCLVFTKSLINKVFNKKVIWKSREVTS